MKSTITVIDVFVRFRMFAIAQSGQQTQAWVMQVMVIQQVADTLVSLGFLDPKVAALLTNASTTITPQPGISTVPLSGIVTLTELIYYDSEPISYYDSEPISLEAQQGHALIVHGETTEEALASAGFVLDMHGPLQ